jgi:hypothetical protein
MKIADNGDISFYEDTGTTAKFFWDASAESLGIGTSSPNSIVDIRENATGGQARLRLFNTDQTNSTAQSALLFMTPDVRANGVEIEAVKENADFSAAANRDIAIVFKPVLNNAATERLRIDSSGNVGIAGQTNPTYKLDGGFANQTWGWYLNSSYNAGFTYNTTERSLLLHTKSAENIDHIKFATGGSATERMRIDASGNVGINQSNPTRKLHVTSAGSGVVATFGDSLANNTIEVTRTTTNASYIGLSATSAVGGIIAGPTFTFSTSNSSGGSVTERMRIDSSGEFTLGNPSGGSALQLDVSATGTDGVDIKSSYYSGGYGPMKLHAGGSERMRIDADGNLMVGTTNSLPGAGNTTAGISLYNDGRIFASKSANTTMSLNRSTSDGAIAEFRKDGTTVGSISVTSSATTYNTSSDQRLKDNIVDASSASDDIDAIQVRSFDWKADGSHQKYGMVAQELQSVAPEAVSQGETEEDMMGVDYSKLVPMMLKEIQSLRARVAQLEGDN